MKMCLFVLATAILFSVPAYSDSIYVLGTYVNPDGRSDIFEQNHIETTFDSGELDKFGATFGYDHFIGEYVNIGGSLTYYKDDASAQDRAFLTPGGAPVRRDFRLKIIPLEFNASVLPMRRSQIIVPFIGAGVGFYRWEYEEAGDFVVNRDSDPRVITGLASSDGTNFGYHTYGGVHIQFWRSAVFTAQVKHFNLEPDLEDDLFDRFEPIDLSSYAYSFGISFWFSGR